MKSTRKNNKNYVLWSDVNKNFDDAKSIVRKLFGSEIDGDHSIDMEFHFIINDEQLKVLSSKIGNSTLDLYIEEEKQNTGTIENDITGAIDIVVNDQALIKLCNNDSGKYIQYSNQQITIDDDTYRKVLNNLVDNREFNTSPFDYKEDYFLSKLGFIQEIMDCYIK